jgi:hypothetical protein
MLKPGIINLLNVVRTALADVSQVANLLTTSESCTVEAVEEDKSVGGVDIKINSVMDSNLWKGQIFCRYVSSLLLAWLKVGTSVAFEVLQQQMQPAQLQLPMQCSNTFPHFHIHSLDIIGLSQEGATRRSRDTRWGVVQGALTKILEVKTFNKFDASRRLSIYYNMIGPLKTN